MRKAGMLVGAALVLAACGGEKAPAADTEAAAPAPAPAAVDPAAGTNHDVNMVLEGTTYKFVPHDITIKPGDQVTFHNVSGGPHNVQFWTDSIPAGAAGPLDANMGGDKLGTLNGPLLTVPNETYVVKFAGVPDGEYRFTCTPHIAMGMNGKIIVAQ